MVRLYFAWLEYIEVLVSPRSWKSIGVFFFSHFSVQISRLCHPARYSSQSFSLSCFTTEVFCALRCLPERFLSFWLDDESVPKQNKSRSFTAFFLCFLNPLVLPALSRLCLPIAHRYYIFFLLSSAVYHQKKKCECLPCLALKNVKTEGTRTIRSHWWGAKGGNARILKVYIGARSRTTGGSTVPRNRIVFSACKFQNDYCFLDCASKKQLGFPSGYRLERVLNVRAALSASVRLRVNSEKITAKQRKTLPFERKKAIPPRALLCTRWERETTE